MSNAEQLRRILEQDFVEIMASFRALDLQLLRGEEEKLHTFCTDVMENVQILTIDGQIAKAPFYIGLYIYELDNRAGARAELDELKVVLKKIQDEELLKLEQ